MRVLHMVGPDTSNTASLRLIAEQAQWLEVVVMAVDGSQAAAQANAGGVPVLYLRPGQSTKQLTAAIEVLGPDLVHLHGALASEAAVPLRAFSHLPLALHLHPTDTDASGQLRRQLRGMRLDWRGGHRAAAICPIGEVRADLSGLPLGITDVVEVRPADITPQWCTALYRRLLLAEAAPAPHNALGNAV